MKRSPILWTLCLALLAACGGGGLLALLPVIGPIGGQWQKDQSPETPPLLAIDGEFFNVGPSAGAAFDNYPTEANYAVGGDFGSLSGPCASANAGESVRVVGSVSGDLLVLTREDNPQLECLRARFTDARTVEVSASTRYRNSTPQFALQLHEWVNADDTTQRFKFTDTGDATDNQQVDLAGCRRISGGARVTFTATLVGYNTATNVGPRIADFVVGGTVFGIGEFLNPHELEFGRNGGPRLLLRRVLAGPTPTDCTPP